jgi:hypothetical protein
LRIAAILLPLLNHIRVTQYDDYWTKRMDDTPKQLLDELRTDLLRKRLGQIALAILLAEAALRFCKFVGLVLDHPDFRQGP